jgi:hypothetical protein
MLRLSRRSRRGIHLVDEFSSYPGTSIKNKGGKNRVQVLPEA